MAVDKAQADLMSAQAASVRNQSQIPQDQGIQESDLPKQNLHPGAGLQHGKHHLIIPVIHNGYIRQMPKQDYADFLSEDVVSQGIFWKDRISYANRVNSDQKFRAREKARLEWATKKHLVWDPTAKWTIGAITPGFRLATKGLQKVLKSMGVTQNAIVGSWKLKNY